jgi:hypothetical protein
MRDDDLAIAYQLAPVICHETAGSPEERYQDYFCKVDFDGDLRANNNWDNLPSMKTVLLPEVYCSLLQTDTHYFALYSVFHPRDWKPLNGHENDMEHAQVVARKTKGAPVVEYVCTNAHHWNHVYYNASAVDLAAYSTRDREALFDGPIVLHEGRPVIYIQPGTGELYELLGQVGHGIQGVVDRPGSRWKRAHLTYEFENGQGLIAFPGPGLSAPLDPSVALHSKVVYRLIPTYDTLWAWRTEIGDLGLFSPTVGRWSADTRSYGRHGRGRDDSRRDYFAARGWPTQVMHPTAFVGNEGVVNAAHPPFAFSLSIPWWAYLTAYGRDPGWIAARRRHNAHIDQGVLAVDNFFDPAHTWYLRLGAPIASAFSTDYYDHPYLAESAAAQTAAAKHRARAATAPSKSLKRRRDTRARSQAMQAVRKVRRATTADAGHTNERTRRRVRAR